MLPSSSNCVCSFFSIETNFCIHSCISCDDISPDVLLLYDDWYKCLIDISDILNSRHTARKVLCSASSVPVDSKSCFVRPVAFKNDSPPPPWPLKRVAVENPDLGDDLAFQSLPAQLVSFQHSNPRNDNGCC